MSFEKLSDGHVPPSAEVFLDTSIHCSKLKGSLFAERISWVLSHFDWKGTSTYTKVEFGNVVLSQAEYFLRKLDEFNSLEQTLDFIGNVLPHGFHGVKVTWSFNLLRAYGTDDAECTERAKLSLRRLMKLGLGFVEHFCDGPLADGTNCYWAEKGVHKRNDGKLIWRTPKCKRDRKRCRIDEFFEDNKEIFERIKLAIDGLNETQLTSQLRGFSATIANALENPKVLLDYASGCKQLADATIAVDGMSYASMFSQNKAESDILTEVLKQTFYFLPPNPERGVLVRLNVPTRNAANTKNKKQKVD